MSGRMRDVWQPESRASRESVDCVRVLRAGPGWYQLRVTPARRNRVIKGLINRSRGDDTFK